MFAFSGGYYGDIYGSSLGGSIALTILAFVLALVGGLLLYFMFLKRSNDGKFTGFKGLLYNFLGFRTLLLDAIVRISYLIITIWITLDSFFLLFQGGAFLDFLLIITLGNILVRIVYEFIMLILIICRNISEINMKIPANKNKPIAPVDNQFQAPRQPQSFNYAAPQQNAAPQYAPFTAPAAQTTALEPAVEAAAPAQEPAAPAKKFCTNCGKEVASGALFCTNCGTSVQ